MLELIAAMLASTVLLLTLSATVLIATQLLETPPDNKAAWQDRMIRDRLASDLRYARQVDPSPPNGINITKASVSGASESVTYTSSGAGWTRQVNGGPVMKLDPDGANGTHFVDGYSAPTDASSASYARLRASSSATTASTAATLDIDVPPGIRSGDLVVLCLAAKTPDTVSVSVNGWQAIQLLAAGGLRMIVIHNTYDPSWPGSIQVSTVPDAAMAGAIVAVENVDVSDPIDWTGADGGFAWSFLPLTHPTPLESSGFSPQHLNLQIFASDLDPWTDGALGLAGFTETLQATASIGNVFQRNTLAIAVRNDATPDLSTQPRLRQQQSATWLQTAIRLEPSP